MNSSSSFWFAVLFLLICSSLQSNFARKTKTQRIGIIGAGIGGTSTAYFLREEFGKSLRDVELVLDVFEPYKVGGRAKNIEIGGRLYEAGASIIHPANFYMQHFVEKFGVTSNTKMPKESSGLDGRFGLYNGKELVFTESKWGNLVTVLAMLYRYGFDVFRLYWMTRDMITKFSRVYSLQSDGVSFDSVTELVREMSPDFVGQLKKSLNDTLTEKGFSEIFISELVSAAVRVNYGQRITIPSFVGNVALAGAESGLWSVNGGNEKVPRALLTHSKANLYKNKVLEVVFNKTENTYSLVAADQNGNVEIFSNYDVVVIAFPLLKNRTSVKFGGLEVPEDAFGTFHRTVATFLKGQPRFSNWCSSESDCPTNIFGCGNNWTLYYSSLGLLSPVDHQKGNEMPSGGERVWKVFSDSSLTEEQLNELFEEIQEKKEIPWLAYPNYSEGDTPKTLSFQLSRGLFYLNSLEWAASALEMSVIAAKNVALLISKDVLETVEPESISSVNYKEL